MLTPKSLYTGDGEVAHVALSDCGIYVRWLFDNPDRANGLDLEVAIDHISYSELAAAFTKVSGKPAQYIDVPFPTYFEGFGLRATLWTVLSIPNMSLLTKLWFGLKFSTKRPSSYNSDPTDPSVMTFEKNFTGFWNIWRESRANTGVIRRNYKLLDEIHPNRIRSAEEWFRKEAEKGDLWERINNMVPILKWSEDGAQGRL